jgi:hypothetical protein
VPGVGRSSGGYDTDRDSGGLESWGSLSCVGRILQLLLVETGVGRFGSH